MKGPDAPPENTSHRPDPVRVYVPLQPLDPADGDFDSHLDEDTATPIEAFPATLLDGPQADVATANVLDMRTHTPPAAALSTVEPLERFIEPEPTLDPLTPVPGTLRTAQATLTYETTGAQLARLILLTEESLKVQRALLASVQGGNHESLVATIQQAELQPKTGTLSQAAQHWCFEYVERKTGSTLLAAGVVAVIGGAVAGGTNGLIGLVGQWVPGLVPVLVALWGGSP